MSDALDSSNSGIGSYILSTVKTMAWRMGTLVVGVGAVVATLLYFKQDSMLYFPEIGGMSRENKGNPRRYRSPSEYQVPFESHKIKCADGVSIHAWLMMRDPNRASDVPTVLFFHGNAGNIGLRLPNALQMLQYLNVNVLLVEYRGYGDSDVVTPNEKGLRLDAEAALRFILKHPKIDAAKIFLFGRSLGGAVAFHLAQYAEKQHLPLAGVIVENTFTSIADMVDHLMAFLAPVKNLVLRIGWNSANIVPTIQSPILYVAGAKDVLVPHKHMLQLYRMSVGSRLAKLYIVKEGTHNDTWVQGGAEYWEAIRAFVGQATESTSLSSSAAAASTATTFQSTIAPGETIPVMPTNMLNIAQESIRSSTSGTSEQQPSKKEL